MTELLASPTLHLTVDEVYVPYKGGTVRRWRITVNCDQQIIFGTYSGPVNISDVTHSHDLAVFNVTSVIPNRRDIHLYPFAVQFDTATKPSWLMRWLVERGVRVNLL